MCVPGHLPVSKTVLTGRLHLDEKWADGELPGKLDSQIQSIILAFSGSLENWSHVAHVYIEVYL